MLAEWSVECAPDDPVLVVPWSDASDPTGNRRFIDLRENPYDLDHLPEAELYAPLLQALRALNAGRSPVFTAKCDAWSMDADELDALRIELDLGDFTLDLREMACGFASYVDLLVRERSVFASFHQNEEFASRLVRRAEPLDYACAMLECVIRPAMVDLTGPQEGFAISLYIKALGVDPESAEANWAAALESVVGIIRGKDLS